MNSLLHFNVSLTEATQHLLSINSRFCQLRLLHCVWIVLRRSEAVIARLPIPWRVIVIIVLWRRQRLGLSNFDWTSRTSGDLPVGTARFGRSDLGT